MYILVTSKSVQFIIYLTYKANMKVSEISAYQREQYTEYLENQL